MTGHPVLPLRRASPPQSRKHRPPRAAGKGCWTCRKRKVRFQLVGLSSAFHTMERGRKQGPRTIPGGQKLCLLQQRFGTTGLTLIIVQNPRPENHQLRALCWTFL
ncbi:hypothetical protein DH86_00002002 [Scytalidium sp. 3C]|nr:hypothetical protein DH86_00002002 [Scytalidium sp. 3C]